MSSRLRPASGYRSGKTRLTERNRPTRAAAAGHRTPSPAGRGVPERVWASAARAWAYRTRSSATLTKNRSASRLTGRQGLVFEIGRHDARVVGAVPRRRRRRVDEGQPQLDAGRARPPPVSVYEEVRLRGVAQKPLVDGSPPWAAGSPSVGRRQHAAGDLGSQEGELRTSERLPRVRRRQPASEGPGSELESSSGVVPCRGHARLQRARRP